MKRIQNTTRAKNIMEELICKLGLRLNGITVLTELASGDYIVTPIMAALAGAKKVFVTGRDSEYGSLEELKKYLADMMEEYDIEKEQIIFTENKNVVAQYINLVTNSGFVRPIDKDFIDALPYDSGISLMFESWEYRYSDIDLESCINHNVPVMGVNENDKRLKIFRYVGLTVLKLLFDLQIEVFKGRFLVLSSGSYLKEIKYVLKSNGAKVVCIDTIDDSKNAIQTESTYFDAIIIAEQNNQDCLIGSGGKYNAYIQKGMWVIHLAGVIEDTWLHERGIIKYPSHQVECGHMSVTTGYMGIRPVIELNAGGLKVGQMLVEGMRKYKNVKKAQEYALNEPCSMAFDMSGKSQKKVLLNLAE